MIVGTRRLTAKGKDEEDEKEFILMELYKSNISFLDFF
jgi:hypothetical protein